MNGESIVVVIPTYNELDNLPKLVAEIFELNIPKLRLVIVDDNSPDGTGAVADKLRERYPIRVIHRPYKMGLGKAYIAAFEDIFQNEKPDYIIQMDADFSHDPHVILQFLKSIQGYDMVLGSRYVRGGAVENWGLVRRIISRFGNFYASAILWLPYKDLTSGFKCFRKSVLEAVDFKTLSSAGYNFQIEMTYKTHEQGFRITEIPITFSERKEGVSKFNLPIIIESFLKVLALRFYEKK